MRRGLGMACLLPLLAAAGCVEYGFHLDLGAEGQAGYRLAIRDRRLAPQALPGLVGMMQAPWLTVSRGEVRDVGEDREIVLEGHVEDLHRLGQLRAFQGVRCFMEPMDGGGMLFQLTRDPVQFRGTTGEVRATVRFPCLVGRTNGTRSADGATVTWNVPLEDLARRELRLWATMPDARR